MSMPFFRDPYPGRPKILFVGLAESSHSQAWIDLLDKAEFNIRLFALPSGIPPADWEVKTYISGLFVGRHNGLRRYLYPGISGKIRVLCGKFAQKIGRETSKPSLWLSRIIAKWKPNIIHTLGLFDGQGGEFYLSVRKKYRLEGIGRWVLQLRGGSDLTLRRHHPAYREIIRQALTECDQIICDNRANIMYAAELGIPMTKFAPIVPVPGAGGIDVSAFSSGATEPSRRERIILWPKAYECQWSKALPVLDAIQIAWEKMKPCEIYMLAATPDVCEWVLAMPEEIRQHCHIFGRIPRGEVLALMKRARILLATSLIDGVPNSLYEAMASGAFPIVSPLETIMSVVKKDENVLFARNLYPEEIAAVLIRAMNDEQLIDQAAENNFKQVDALANRQTIKMKVVNFYASLLGEAWEN